MVGIGEPIVYDDQLLPFYCKRIAVKCFGNNEGFRNLPWETCLPEVFQVIWIDLCVHRFGHSRRCNGSCMRKMIQYYLDTKCMVAMRMGNRDRGQVFPTFLHPIHQLSVLVNGRKGISKNGIL